MQPQPVPQAPAEQEKWIAQFKIKTRKKTTVMYAFYEGSDKSSVVSVENEWCYKLRIGEPARTVVQNQITAWYEPRDAWFTTKLHVRAGFSSPSTNMIIWHEKLIFVTGSRERKEFDSQTHYYHRKSSTQAVAQKFENHVQNIIILNWLELDDSWTHPDTRFLLASEYKIQLQSTQSSFKQS